MVIKSMHYSLAKRHRESRDKRQMVTITIKVARAEVVAMRLNATILLIWFQKEGSIHYKTLRYAGRQWRRGEDVVEAGPEPMILIGRLRTVLPSRLR